MPPWSVLLAACSPEPTCPRDLGYATYDTVDQPADDELLQLVEGVLPSIGIRDPSAAAPVAALLREHARAWVFWSTAIRVRPERMRVLDRLRRLGLPDVFEMIPYDAARYDLDAHGPHGEHGLWLLPEDVAGLRVEDCRYVETSDRVPVERWLDHCRVDERTDPDRATEAALARLAATWDATGHDLLATIRPYAPNAHAVVAQFLAAVCYDATLDPTRYPLAETAHCPGLVVPTAEQVAVVYHP